MRVLRFVKSQAAVTAVVFAAAMLSAGSAYAWAQWIIDTSATAPEKNFDDAPQWFDASNWTNGYIAANAGDIAYFWKSGENWDSGIRYVNLDRDLAVAQIVRRWSNTRVQSHVDANRRVVLGGDHTITLDGGGIRVFLAGLKIYGNIDIVTSSSNPQFSQVDICGPLSNDSGRLITFNAMTGLDAISRFRRDLWADGTSEGITNFAPSTVHFDQQVHLGFYAPEGSDGVSGTWKLTEGSAIVRRVGDAHALSAGTIVTGDGVPPGAYVKRIYSDAIFELSAVATATSVEEGTALSFAAFHPKAYQCMKAPTTEYHDASKYRYYDGYWPMKHSPDDEMTVEVFDLTAPSGAYHFYVDCENGYLPGRLVFHNTSKFNRNLYLGTCEVEFAATTNNTSAGFPNAVKMLSAASGGAGDTARVIVPEGVEARFGSLANVIGTIIKDGAGSLTASVLSNEVFAAGSTGTLVVESGSLALECAEDAPIQVDTLAITNGATFTIPSCGLEVQKVFAESGAVVNGTGFFYVIETNDVSGISFGDGITLVRLPASGATSASADFYWETNVTEGVVGEPAYWFDASKADSFEYAGESVARRGYENRVLKWYDARGEEYGCATCYWATATSPRAQYVYTNELGETRMVMVYNSSSSEPEKRHVLQWNRRVSGIRSVFKVVPSLGTTSVFLGGSNRGRGSGTYYNYDKPLFGSVPESYTNGIVFYVNGDRRDWREGYPYGVSKPSSSSYYNGNPDLLVRMVAEVHFPDDATYAANFGYIGKYDNGRDFICECLVYTNELTEAQRLAVRKYLSRKWIDASLNYKPVAFEGADALDSGSGIAYRVDGGEALVHSALVGNGKLTKYGEGTAVFERTSSNAIHVVGGEVKVCSRPVPERGNLPVDAYLHLDASDADSIVVEGGRVVSWADVRGAGHPVATALNEGKGPLFEDGALNSMPAVDFGVHNGPKISTYGKTCPTLVYDPVSNAHSVVSVLLSVGGGGPLIGWHVQSQMSVSGNILWGLDRNLRYSGSSVDNPIVWGSALSGAYYDLAFPLRDGGSRVRLNGDEVDGTTTPFTCNGVYDMVSLVSHRPIRAGAIGQIGYSNNTGYFNYGGYKICELLIYTNVLSRAEVKAVEAYLNKKWFNRVSEGYEPAAAKSVEVDAGARLEVWGGAPVEVESLSVAGTLDGAANVADGGEIAAVVSSDGTVAALDITGGIGLHGGGTLVLSGDVGKIAAGSYPLAAVNSGTAAGWTVAVSEPTRKRFQLSVEDERLVLTVIPPGAILIVK